MALADEILAALPALLVEHRAGPKADAVSAYLACRELDARRAMEKLDADGLAVYLRYPGSKARHLVPLDFPLDPGFSVCGQCRVVFERPYKRKRICCGRSCASAWKWRQPGASDRYSAAIKAAKQTPEARAQQVANNAARWSRPGERERLSERNRKMWADPATRAKMSAAIQRVNGAPEARAEIGARFKANWADPEGRERARAAIKAARNTPEFKAKFHEAMKERWKDPAMRAKYTAANKARNDARFGNDE